MNEKIESTIIIMKATDSQLLKFLATQKFYDICKSTGNFQVALEVLKSSIDLHTPIPKTAEVEKE